MEQTVEENPDVDESVEDSPQKTNREYSLDLLDRHEYRQVSETKINESKITKKDVRNSSERGGLEQKVSRIETEKSGEDIEEYSSFKLTEHPLYAGNEEKKSEEGEDTPNGTGIIVYYRNPITGKLEFLVEQKTVKYPKEEARGKFSFIGGAIKTNESDLEAAIRETEEEVSEPAASIIIRELTKNPQVYTTLHGIIDGQPFHTVILEVEIKSTNEWETVKCANMYEGNPRVLTDEKALKYKNYFAFGYGQVIEEFIDKNSTKRFVPIIYDDSLLPKHAGLSLKLLNSKENYSYSYKPNLTFHNPN